MQSVAKTLCKSINNTAKTNAKIHPLLIMLIFETLALYLSISNPVQKKIKGCRKNKPQKKKNKRADAPRQRGISIKVRASGVYSL